MNRQILVLLALILVNISIFAKSNTDTLQIAVYNSPPFGFTDMRGNITGLSVECWLDVAQLTGFNYHFHLTDMDDLLDGLQTKRYDVAIGAITITPRREKLVDFTHPVNASGTGIAVSTRSDRHPFWSLWQLVFINVLELIGGLILLLIFFGLIMWLIERRSNPDQFSRNFKGFFDGVWWAAVTMTTVGYGDKSPKTAAGRVITIFWMFTSVILVSLFTASTSSILTTSKMESNIEDSGDLRHSRVGAATHSSGEEYLIRHKIKYKKYDNIEEALQAVLDNEINAVVSNVPVLKYMINSRFNSGIRVVPKLLAENYMGMALTENSKHIEKLNNAILIQTADDKWKTTVTKYLGED